MLSLTRKADYALVALVFLGHADQSGVGPVSARTIAESFGLPQPVLMSTLKTLAQRGLVQSRRGVAGGYALAREPSRISLLDAVHAVEGEAAGADAADASRAVVHRLERRLEAFFEGLTVADLLDEADPNAENESLVHLRTGAGPANMDMIRSRREP